jgi:methionyl-tRNA formyltransferase
MNYIFFGSPEFAAIILEKLITAGFVPQAVVCNPDRPVGRKKIITSPPTKLLAQKYNISALQPEVLSNSKLEILNSKPDFAIVASYAKIIPKNILELFPKGIIGVHPSLLPKYRGPTPIQSVILNGEAETGVTLYLLDEKVDHGPIIAQRALENNDLRTINYVKLHDALANLGADLLIETLPKFIEGKIKPVAQNEAEATFTKKFENRDGYVDLEKDDPVIIEKKVRALNPEPGVWTIVTAETVSLIRANKKIIGKRMKILEAEIIGGKLILKKIQFEGGKPQSL